MTRSTSSVVILRISASVLLLLSVLFMPSWVSIILAFASMVYFRYFVEAVVLMLLSDLLYGVHEVKFFGIVFVSFIGAILCLMLIEFIKKKTIFGN